MRRAAESTRATAILIAAGSGQRLGGTGDKAFRNLGGKPIIYYSLKALELSPDVGGIVIVVRKNLIERCKRFVNRLDATKVLGIVAGGKRRQDSVMSGLKFATALGGSNIVLVHDAARPFLTQSLISRTVAACLKTGAAIAALPVSDTVKRVRGILIEETVSRKGLWLAQTPQVFRRALLERAFRRWPSRTYATDDACLVSGVGKKVTVVDGDPFNIKVTFPSDVLLAEAVLRLSRRP